MAIEDLYFIEPTIVNLLCLSLRVPLYLCSCQAFFVVLSFNYTFHWIISKKVSSKVWLKIIIDRVIVDQGDCFKLSIHLRQVLNWFYIHFYYYLCNAFEIYW